LGTLKPGKELITDMSAVSIFTLMPGTSIIYMDIIRNLKSGGKNLIFFSMENISVLIDNSIDLTGRDVSAELKKLLKN